MQWLQKKSLWALLLTNSNGVTCLPRKTWHNVVASLNAANAQVHIVLCWASHVERCYRINHHRKNGNVSHQETTAGHIASFSTHLTNGWSAESTKLTTNHRSSMG